VKDPWSTFIDEVRGRAGDPLVTPELHALRRDLARLVAERSDLEQRQRGLENRVAELRASLAAEARQAVDRIPEEAVAGVWVEWVAKQPGRPNRSVSTRADVPDLIAAALALCPPVPSPAGAAERNELRDRIAEMQSAVEALDAEWAKARSAANPKLFGLPWQMLPELLPEPRDLEAWADVLEAWADQIGTLEAWMELDPLFDKD
jgi:hypothetical protein